MDEERRRKRRRRRGRRGDEWRSPSSHHVIYRQLNINLFPVDGSPHSPHKLVWEEEEEEEETVG